MKLLTADQMQAVDRQAIEGIGIPGVVLMENAGRCVADEISRRFSSAGSSSALVLSGKGQNGGDGYVIARCLLDKGWFVHTVVLAERGAVTGDAAVNLLALEKCGGMVSFVTDEEKLTSVLSAAGVSDVLVDALLGTGLAKNVEGLYKRTIEWVNIQPLPVVSVDVPSGVDASSGCILGAAVIATLTVTFAFAKVGLASYPGAAHVGELLVTDIGIPAPVARLAPNDCLLIDKKEASRLLPLRSPDGHKGTFGHLLVLAGSTGKSGAAIMAAESGLRSGAGLVTLACPLNVQPSVAARVTEVMTVPLVDCNGEVSLQALGGLIQQVQDKQALAIGPGMGVGDEVCELVRQLLQKTDVPVVIDADGLTALCSQLHLFEQQANRQVVLTPHPGEMARLTGLSTTEIQANRFHVARDFAVQHGVVLVLKGARTLIASPDGKVCVNTSGHAGLASGGMGDVLTGVVGGLLAQGMSAFAAATLGVYLHGLAADQLLPRFGTAGLLATDIMCELPAARQALVKEA